MLAELPAVIAHHLVWTQQGVRRSACLSSSRRRFGREDGEPGAEESARRDASLDLPAWDRLGSLLRETQQLVESRSSRSSGGSDLKSRMERYESDDKNRYDNSYDNRYENRSKLMKMNGW